MQKPSVDKSTIRAPTAIPTLAPRVKPPFDSLKVDSGVAVGLVIFTEVLENRLPSSETVFPGVGCWRQDALSAVTTIHFT